MAESEKEPCTHTPDGVLIRGPEGYLAREFRVKCPEEAAKLDCPEEAAKLDCPEEAAKLDEQDG